MAEPESILQLGIEAARENKKEEARQLFRLLTRQEPDNAQGWLWLAGVAENREERQNALERVRALDPTNEMAIKGLQALGVHPAPVEEHPPEVSPPPAPSTVAVPVPVVPPAAAKPAPPPPPDDDPFGDDDPFAELNNLSETMASDTSGPVRRAEPTPDPDALEVGAPSRRSDDSSRSPSRSSGSSSSSRGSSSASSSRSSSSSRGSSSSRRPSRGDDDEYEPRGGISSLMGLILFLIGLALIGLLVAWLMPGIFDRNQAARPSPNATRTATAARTAQAGLAATSAILGGAPSAVGTSAPMPTLDPNAPVPTLNPNVPVSTVGPTGPVPTVGPNGVVPTVGTNPPAGQPAQPTADVRQANPAVMNANNPLQSAGWTYDFNQPNFAASIIGTIGQNTPKNGRFVVVLVYAFNSTGTAQPIPGNFFVLKDAQGRVWEARPEVSTAYVVPGVNADLAHTQPFPSDGITRSVAVIFDVAPDATDLMFFARSNPGQGWLVLRSV